MLRKLLLFGCLLPLLSGSLRGQAPDLIGYWQNWFSANAPYIPLDEIDDRYSVVQVAFALPATGTTYQMTFEPEGVDVGTFTDQIQMLQAQGKEVLLSLGGATGTVILHDEMEKNVFVNSLLDLLLTYGFDGFDIDLEGNSVTISGGTIAEPVDPPIQFLIQGIREVMEGYHELMGKPCLLTMAPETAFVQGGQSNYNGVWGAYLPVIDALRDSIDILHVQLYNSGSMYGIDGGIYYQATADFIVSQTEALLQGFATAGGFFDPLLPEQIAVGLPACPDAAGGGYTDPADVEAAIQYLRSGLDQPGLYTTVGIYPELRGMMTWSINWDAKAECGGSYAYADNYSTIFELPVSTLMPPLPEVLFSFSPNPLPVGNLLRLELGEELSGIRILDQLGRVRLSYDSAETETSVVDLSLPLPAGMYVLVGNGNNGQTFSRILVVSDR